MLLPCGKFDEVVNRSDAPIVNVGSGTDLTVAELADLIAEIVGYHGRILFDITKPDGTPRKLLDCGYLESLGWRAQIPLRRGLTSVYDEYRASRSRRACAVLNS
jgi:GDP-L-fucose synthase